MNVPLSLGGAPGAPRRPFVILYYKRAAGKKKELFCKFVQFTIIFFRKQERGAQKTQKCGKAVCPEVPEGTEERGEEGEAERCAERGGEEHIKAQLAGTDAEGKGEERGGEEQAEERVERAGQGAVCAAAQAQGTQTVVEQGERRAEQERGGKAFKLGTDLDAHFSHRRGGRAVRRRRGHPRS